MTRLEQLTAEAQECLEHVDFKRPQLNVAWEAIKAEVVDHLATTCNNLPWEEWADEPEEAESA